MFQVSCSSTHLPLTSGQSVSLLPYDLQTKMLCPSQSWFFTGSHTVTDDWFEPGTSVSTVSRVLPRIYACIQVAPGPRSWPVRRGGTSRGLSSLGRRCDDSKLAQLFRHIHHCAFNWTVWSYDLLYQGPFCVSIIAAGLLAELGRRQFLSVATTTTLQRDNLLEAFLTSKTRKL